MQDPWRGSITFGLVRIPVRGAPLTATEAATPDEDEVLVLAAFVRPEEIEPVYYDAPCLLEPLKGAAPAYILLRAAMERSGRYGLASFSRQGRPAAGLVYPYADGLALSRVRMQAEFETRPGPHEGASKLGEAELELALALIGARTAPFTPAAVKRAMAFPRTEVGGITSGGAPTSTSALPAALRRSVAAAAGRSRPRRSSPESRL